MALPIIVVGAAALAGSIGLGTGTDGVIKFRKAKKAISKVELRHQGNIEWFEERSSLASRNMDDLGKKELGILDSFDEFVEIFEKIQGKPVFHTHERNGINIPEYDPEKIKEVSFGARILLGGLGGAAMGTAGGFAAAGATTSAVMALGTASTGTAIASLSGAAATNATLAALGGGALAANGGGIALGVLVLNAATFGVALMVGGVIFNIAGASFSKKADEAWRQMEEAEKQIEKICLYLKDLSNISVKFKNAIDDVEKIYRKQLIKLSYIVNDQNKVNWEDYSDVEKLTTENTVLLVNLLYNMCKVQLVLASGNDSEHNTINTGEVEKQIDSSSSFLTERALV